MRTKTYVEAVASLFDLIGCEKSMQQAMRDDLEASDPEELARAFKGVAELLRGMESTAEGSFGLAGELVFGEARLLAQFALMFCKAQPQGAESHFGNCPECGTPGTYRNIYKTHVFACDEHKLAWVGGYNLMSSWQYETEQKWRENYEELKDYEIVGTGRTVGEDTPLEDLLPES